MSKRLKINNILLATYDKKLAYYTTFIVFMLLFGKLGYYYFGFFGGVLAAALSVVFSQFIFMNIIYKIFFK